MFNSDVKRAHMSGRLNTEPAAVTWLFNSLSPPGCAGTCTCMEMGRTLSELSWHTRWIKFNVWSQRSRKVQLGPATRTPGGLDRPAAGQNPPPLWTCHLTGAQEEDGGTESRQKSSEEWSKAEGLSSEPGGETETVSSAFSQGENRNLTNFTLMWRSSYCSGSITVAVLLMYFDATDCCA